MKYDHRSLICLILFGCNMKTVGLACCLSRRQLLKNVCWHWISTHPFFPIFPVLFYFKIYSEILNLVLIPGIKFYFVARSTVAKLQLLYCNLF